MNMRGDYLTINVVNSYSGKVKAKKADKSSVLREHGWGRIIIKDIAKKYGGQFNTVISKNMYTAKVILCSDKRGENNNQFNHNKYGKYCGSIFTLYYT